MFCVVKPGTHLAFRRTSAASSTALLRSFRASSRVRHWADFFSPALWEATRFSSVLWQSLHYKITPQITSKIQNLLRSLHSAWANAFVSPTTQLEALRISSFQRFVLALILDGVINHPITPSATELTRKQQSYTKWDISTPEPQAAIAHNPYPSLDNAKPFQTRNRTIF